MKRPLLLTVFLFLLLLALASCSAVRYTGQAVWGQTRILAAQKPIEKLLADPKTPETLRRQLETVLEIREFAVEKLKLPDNGSYTTFVELAPAEGQEGRRRSVVWNVVAAPELEVAPIVWCFPVAGCVSYRGYFSEQGARRYATRLERKGYDVAVSGAAAYSTLGWFRDPVLSTVIDYPPIDLAGLLFHELAHQVVYVADDTRFNESFATAVELAGVRRFLAATGQDPELLAAYRERKHREEQFVGLVLEYRSRLQELYASEAPAQEKRRLKEATFKALRHAYREKLRAGWDAERSPQAVAFYDAWFERDLGNAHLAQIGAYHDLVPAFERLLEEVDGDLERFYAEVGELAELPPEERETRLGLTHRLDG